MNPTIVSQGGRRSDRPIEEVEVSGVQRVERTVRVRGAGRPRQALPIVALLAIVAAGCGDDGDAAGSAADGLPTVIATTSIWADVVANVACDGLADVQSLIPAGGDPHEYEPSLQDRGRLEDAALVVANGFLLEETLEDTLEAVAAEGVTVLEVAPLVPDPIEGGHEHSEDEHSEDEHSDETHSEDEHSDETHSEDEHGDEGGFDPHVWHDPSRVAAILPAIGDALVESAGLDAETVDACVEAYVTELVDLDAELEAQYAGIPEDRRLLVTNHDSLRYLADRYGLTVLGSVIPSSSSLAETNPADLQALADEIAATGAPAVFAETQGSTTDADALAAEVGVPVVTLTTDTLGGEGSGAETYVDLLRTNAGLIVGALTADAATS
jgi:zinc/manganese transport system substrate-binding protein